MYPALLPPEVQIALLDKLLHRDLVDSRHKTNVHLHYDVPYPPVDERTGEGDSFFDESAERLV